jgi:hypothetical protein
MSDDGFVSRKEMLKYMLKLWSIMAALLIMTTVLLHVTSGGPWVFNILIAILPVYFMTLIGESVYRKVVDNSSL